MVKTVQTFSVCHYIDTLTELKNDEINKKYLGMQWTSVSLLIPGGTLSSFFQLRRTPEIGPGRIHTRIIITLTNRHGEKFVKTRVGDIYSACACFIHDVDRVGVAVTLNYDVEVTGVFPKQEKPKTRNFGASNPVLTDVVLVAGGQRFHVNKAILSTHSSYFRDLLATGKAEYELENITPKVFQEILQVLYHVPEIYDDNVEELLEAARTFDVLLVTRACKEQLKRSSCCIIDEDKKRLCKEYGLELLTGIQKDFGIRGDLDDVILKLEDQTFHVNRGILATHSSYFYTMFFGGFQESKESEIELKDIDPETFEQLLEVIYHCPNIHENNVENLLDLNRMYDVRPVTAQCQKFINGENDFPMEEKRRLIEEYFPK